MHSKLMVAMRLMGLVVSRPVEFYDRSRAIVEDKFFKIIWPHAQKYDELDWQELLVQIGSIFNCNPAELFAERAYIDANKHCQSAIEKLIACQPPFPIEHNADELLSKLVYLAVRLLKPNNVVECGTAYGIVATMTLAAMAENGHGQLSSIDLCPLRKNASDYIGYLIPDNLRHAWKLYRGTSVRVLPELMKQLPSVDLSIHDSLSTYRNYSQELQLVSPNLSANSAVIVNCAAKNKAFYEWCQGTKPVLSAYVPAKTEPDLIGIAFLNDDTTSA